MQKLACALVAIFAVLLAASACSMGCGQTAATVTDAVDASADAPGCSRESTSCANNTECCSGACDQTTKKCAAGVGICGQAGAACKTNLECCALNCNNAVCGQGKCVSDTQACSANGECCSGTCDAGKCKPLNTTCRTAGNACTQSAECCSKLCAGGTCALASSYCIQNGDICSRANDCCGGVCNMAAGATVGTCGAPPAGPSFCNGGVDGTVCDECNNCCSRLCAPYGATGVKICQPATGCHIDGDLCRKDSDCCGAAGSGLPGDGNVTCEIAQGFQIGICRNPKGCNPEGNVCHYKQYACGNSSARNDCCGAVGNSGECQLDSLGVPRCHGIGACKNVGDTCAYSGDCCNNVPCVPDPNGVLRCTAGSCLPLAGSCTTDADCCSGLSCIIPLGSTKGTCGTKAPPTGSDAGIADGGGSTCAFYGQSCTQSAQCCNNVSCTAADGLNACNGGAGCHCANPVPR